MRTAHRWLRTLMRALAVVTAALLGAMLLGIVVRASATTPAPQFYWPNQVLGTWRTGTNTTGWFPTPATFHVNYSWRCPWAQGFAIGHQHPAGSLYWALARPQAAGSGTVTITVGDRVQRLVFTFLRGVPVNCTFWARAVA